jgi:hypothetical protein
VGNYKGIQLYEADFNPKMPTINEQTPIAVPHTRSNSFASYHDLQNVSNGENNSQSKLSTVTNGKISDLSLISNQHKHTVQELLSTSLYVDTTFDDSGSMYPIRLAQSNSDSASNLTFMNGQTQLSSSQLTLNLSISEPGTRSIKRDQNNQSKFQTHTLKMLAIDLQINEALLLGKRTWDEHFEYLIEIRLLDEYWFVLRRYSKIRQLHDQMSLLYPSLTRLVFPMRLLFNSSDKQIIERQIQLEHYLKCKLTEAWHIFWLS